ncbi:MAG: sensor histidine kinase [Chitinophagales bacterium]
MKVKLFQSIRWKIILLFVASIAAAVAVVEILIYLAYTYHHYWFFYDLLSGLKDSVGIVPVSLSVGLTFFVLFFFLFSQGVIKYIEELNRGLQEVAEGNLEVSLLVKSRDELGQLARNINIMTRQLKASLEEERNSQQSKQHLITSVSHDLRTPLTSLLGYLELIENDNYRDEVELRHYVSIAYQKSQQINRLIAQLFEFTRTGYGGVEIRPKVVNLAELLEQLAEEFVPSLQAAGMEYNLVLPAETVKIPVDTELLVRLFENLISNAIRYGSEGKRLDLELSKDGPDVVIRVANYGTPIPDWELPRLFETFYRVEKSRSQNTGGTGLGLAIAKNIVDLHEGKIRAYNESNRTVFEVRLQG